MQVGIKGVGQVEALDQKQGDAQASKASSASLGGVVVVDILVREETLTLLLPALFAQAMGDAALAVAQALLDTPLALALLFLYLGLHLKYLAQQGKQAIG
jgi:hypothetical protein